MKADQIALYADVREKRAQLEKKAQELKEIEQKIKAEILMELDSLGIDSFKEGGYTLSRKHTVRAEVADHTLLQERMFKLMSEAKAEGRPLQDGLLLQRTVSKSAVVDYIRGMAGLAEDQELDIKDSAIEQIASEMGVRLVDNIDLSIRKTK